MAIRFCRGERIPGQDILLRTALALHLSLKDTQRLLAVGTVGPSIQEYAGMPRLFSH